MRFTKRLTAAAAAAVVAMVLAFPGVAHASSSMCSVNGRLLPFPHKSCTTGAVAANASHWIDVYVDPYNGCTADYYVWDTQNGAVINQRTGVGPNFIITLSNVYSSYRLKATFNGWGCGGEAELDNELPQGG